MADDYEDKWKRRQEEKQHSAGLKAPTVTVMKNPSWLKRQERHVKAFESDNNRLHDEARRAQDKGDTAKAKELRQKASGSLRMAEKLKAVVAKHRSGETGALAKYADAMGKRAKQKTASSALFKKLGAEADAAKATRESGDGMSSRASGIASSRDTPEGKARINAAAVAAGKADPPKEEGGDKSIQTGKRGGRYYLGPSGEKVYVK